MLTLTAAAITAIRTLTGEMGTDHAGLRIANDEAGRLNVTLAGGPTAGDAIVERAGARLYLAPEAAEALDSMALIVEADRGGILTFGVQDQRM